MQFWLVHCHSDKYYDVCEWVNKSLLSYLFEGMCSALLCVDFYGTRAVSYYFKCLLAVYTVLCWLHCTAFLDCLHTHASQFTYVYWGLKAFPWVVGLSTALPFSKAFGSVYQAFTLAVESHEEKSLRVGLKLSWFVLFIQMCIYANIGEGWWSSLCGLAPAWQRFSS